jgi:uncharacterized repeat protein (TIGR04138 family)
MNGKNFNEVVQLVRREDSRYETGAYHFIRIALDYTLKKIREEDGNRENRHVSGAELSMGIKEFALTQFGPMVPALFKEWGIRSTEDFGEIVFNLVEYEVFGKTENDRKEDFQNVFDFFTAFEFPYLPPSKQRARGPKKRASAPTPSPHK